MWLEFMMFRRILSVVGIFLWVDMLLWVGAIIATRIHYRSVPIEAVEEELNRLCEIRRLREGEDNE